MSTQGKDIRISTVVCPCSERDHAKAYMVEKTTNNNKKQYFCVHAKSDGASCTAVGYICEQRSMKCICCHE